MYMAILFINYDQMVKVVQLMLTLMLLPCAARFTDCTVVVVWF